MTNGAGMPVRGQMQSLVPSGDSLRHDRTQRTVLPLIGEPLAGQGQRILTPVQFEAHPPAELLPEPLETVQRGVDAFLQLLGVGPLEAFGQRSGSRRGGTPARPAGSR